MNGSWRHKFAEIRRNLSVKSLILCRWISHMWSNILPAVKFLYFCLLQTWTAAEIHTHTHGIQQIDCNVLPLALSQFTQRETEKSNPYIAPEQHRWRQVPQRPLLVSSQSLHRQQAHSSALAMWLDKARRKIWPDQRVRTDPRRLWRFLERIGAVIHPLRWLGVRQRYG